MSSLRPALAHTVSVTLLVALLAPLAHAQGVSDLTPAILLSKTSVAVTEGGATDTYTVALRTAPAGPSATVAIASTSGQVLFLANGATTPAATVTLTFTPLNFGTAQAVTVVAQDDASVEGGHADTVTHTGGGDPTYNGVSKSLPASVADNDAGLAIRQTDGDTRVNEKPAPVAVDQDTFTIGVGTAPTHSVTVRLTPDPQLSVSQLTATFTPANWKNPKTITVLAADDKVAEGVHHRPIGIATTSADPAYNNLASSILVRIADDDAAGWMFATATGTPATSPPGLAQVAEGGSTSYRAKLTSQPTSPVTLTPAGAGLSFSPASVTFDASNWETLQSIGITVLQDSIDRSTGTYTATVTQGVASADPMYTAAPASFSFSVQDDDTAAILLAHSGVDTAVTEGGATDTILVALQTQPVAGVTVGLSAPAAITLSPTALSFDATNWNVAQIVTVTAADDAAGELSTTVTLTASGAGSADGMYAGKTQTLTVNVHDDDGVVAIVQSGGSTIAAEGSTDSFTLALIDNPPSDVTVTLTASSGEFSVSPTSFVFRPTSPAGPSARNPCPPNAMQPGNAVNDCTWNVARTVTFTPTNDDRIDGAATGTIQVAVSGGGAAFDGKSPRPIPVTAVDNDSAGIVLSTTAISAGEGATTTYTVKLATQPTAPVTVTPTGLGDALPSAPMTFTDATWNTPQTVTVAMRQDDIDKSAGTYTASITHAATSADAHYASLVGGAVTATITDNDNAGYLFATAAQPTLARNTLPNALTLSEGDATWYSIRLSSEPTSNVVLTVTPASGATVSPAEWTFTPTNWNTAQRIDVTVTENFVQQSTSTYGLTVGNGVASADTFYSSAPGTVALTVTEDDVAKLTLAATGGGTTVQEGGATDTVTFVLDTQPTAGVTVTLTLPSGVEASPASLAFTTSNWGTAQTVTLTATDDATAEFRQTPTLSAATTTSDTVYATKTATLPMTVLDNDGVLLVTPAGEMAVTEGGASASYTVELIDNPTSDVTVTIASTGQLRFNGATTLELQFKPQSAAGTDVPVPCDDDQTENCIWNNPQAVTVTADDDSVVEGRMAGLVVTHTVDSADPRFDGVPTPPLLVDVDDNDAGAFLVQSGGATAVTEGGAADSYTVALSTAPTFSVAVTLSANSRLSVSPATLLFDADNWDQPQEVTVLALDDGVDQPNVVTYAIHHAATSGDAAYNGLAIPDVSVAVTDNDQAGLAVQESAGATRVTEGGATDTYTLALAAQPAADVQVAVTASGPATASPGTLTFTPANWQAPQTVTVAAVDDSAAQGTRTATLTHTLTSTDLAYHNLAAPGVTVTVDDNDVAGVAAAHSGGSTTVQENGAGDSFTVRLTSRPADTVTLAFGAPSPLLLSATHLTFTTGNWNTPQTVAASVPNDDVARGIRTLAVTVTLSSTDAAYSGAAPSIPVTVRDDDGVGVVFGQSASNVAVTEGGAGSSYAFRLQSEPLANVVVQLSPDVQLTLGVSSLTFTPANWRTYQTVPVAAVNDAAAEGAHQGVVSHAASSDDPSYNGLAIATVSVAITDND